LRGKYVKSEKCENAKYTKCKKCKKARNDAIVSQRFFANKIHVQTGVQKRRKSAKTIGCDARKITLMTCTVKSQGQNRMGEIFLSAKTKMGQYFGIFFAIKADERHFDELS